MNLSLPNPAACSRLIIGQLGPSDSALAAARGWRLCRPAADRHAARCASQALCSGGAPRRYPPSRVKGQRPKRRPSWSAEMRRVMAMMTG